MVTAKPTIVFDLSARNDLHQSYFYLKNAAPHAAEKMRMKILQAIEKLADNPWRYPPDRFSLDNDDACRAFECFRYRITYRITPGLIIIIRIRHTRMQPQFY